MKHDMTMDHEPDPDFARFLEWQTRTELRRLDRFEGAQAAEGPRAPWMGRAVRIAAIVLVSVLSGAGLVVANQHAQDSRAFEALLQRNEILLELSERRVAAAAVAAEREQALQAAGLAPRAPGQGAAARLAELERERDHRGLDREELIASRRDVNRSLTAPLVGVRDFAIEHLRIDRQARTGKVEHAAQARERQQMLFDEGLVSSGELLEATRTLSVERADLALVDARIDLRLDFVEGRIDALQCESQDLALSVENRIDRLRPEVLRLENELERARTLAQAGRIRQGEVTSLEADLETARAEIELAELELKALK